MLENLENTHSKEYQKAKDHLILFAKSINPHELNFEGLEMFLISNREHAHNQNFYNICSNALDILIKIPSPLFLENVTPGFDANMNAYKIENTIECYSVNDTSMYWISILSIFENKQQVPYSWQIFFANKHTKLFELEQFITLAFNMTRNTNLFYHDMNIR